MLKHIKINRKMYSKTKLTMLTVISFLVFGCNNGPKEITPSSERSNPKENGVKFTSDPSAPKGDNPDSKEGKELHEVFVNEVLPASRYNYLNVTEKGRKFWIATRKQDIEKGETYFYKGGLLKTKFESKEHNRVFDTVYLITNLVGENHTSLTETLSKSNSNVGQSVAQKEDLPANNENIIQRKGSLKIADLVKDPNKYEGQIVQISGRCVKINKGIMDKNWIHIQDGTKDDYDLVITTDTFVPEEGTIATIRALVTLDKDFGAGYKYELILENGSIVE